MVLLENCYFDAPGGCLMANIVLEPAKDKPEFIGIIKQLLEEWIATYAYIFQSQHEQAKAQMLAEQAIQKIKALLCSQ